MHRNPYTRLLHWVFCKNEGCLDELGLHVIENRPTSANRQTDMCSEATYNFIHCTGYKKSDKRIGPKLLHWALDVVCKMKTLKNSIDSFSGISPVLDSRLSCSEAWTLHVLIFRVNLWAESQFTDWEPFERMCVKTPTYQMEMHHAQDGCRSPSRQSTIWG